MNDPTEASRTAPQLIDDTALESVAGGVLTPVSLDVVGEGDAAAQSILIGQGSAAGTAPDSGTVADYAHA